MKRVLIVSALLFLAAVCAGVSNAQTQREEPKYLTIPHRAQLFIEGGGALPTQPSVWGEYWNPGFQFGIGGGVSIFSWLEVNVGLSTSSASLDGLAAKQAIRYQGLSEVEGGNISTRIFYGSARFIAVPSARTNPYAAVAVGYFKASGEDVVIEDATPSGDFVNSMEDASGISVAPSFGLQYSLADYWGAYVQYTYTVNLSDSFAPGDLVQPINGSRVEPEGKQVIQDLTVGIMLRF